MFDLPEIDTLAKVALGSVPVIGLALGGHNAYITNRADRRRNQPVVIAHMIGELHPGDHGRWTTLIQLENGGGGPAFDVRFGIEVRGVRFPYIDPDSKDGDASRLRMLPAGATIPPPPDSSATPPAALPLVVATPEVYALARGEGRAIGHDVIYWCWFKNSYGQTWETLNPVDPSGDLRIRRVWRPARSSRAQQRARTSSLEAWSGKDSRMASPPAPSESAQ